MRKPYRCNVCFRSFDTFDQAHAHWFSVHESDSDGTATAAANGDLPVPQDCQARAESIAQPHPKAGQHD
jgi:hypothetical protein